MNSKNASASVAVVITTYNNPTSLELCLASFSRQSFTSFEVFIADDGSKEETRELILKMKREVTFQIYHIWHPDEGYRKAKINNTVFRQLDPKRYPVILCVDHDVIVHRRFVEDHFRVHQAAEFKPLLFMGRRVDLGPKLTSKINRQTVLSFTQGLNLDLLVASLLGDTKNVLRSVRVDGPKWWIHLLKRDRVYDLLGSNFSISTQLMIEINGYNEDFKSYWGEDGDLFVRVRNRGVLMEGRMGYAIQWHLYHKRLEETPAHIEKYQTLLKDVDYKICKNGIQKL